MREELKGLIGALREALSRLALPADVQLKWLKWIGTLPCVDELALDFDDCYRCLPEMVAEGIFSREQAELVDLVDAILHKMSGKHNAELWGPAALRERPEWDEVRRLARAALQSMGDTGKEFEGLIRDSRLPPDSEGQGGPAGQASAPPLPH